MSGNFDLLTSKQKKVYAVIEAFIRSKGYPPTVREIGELLGEKTPGAIQGILNRLEQKGVIKRQGGMARSIQLVDENSRYEDHVYIPEVKRIDNRTVNSLLSVYNIVKYHPLSSSMISSDTDCFIYKDPYSVTSNFSGALGEYLVVATGAEVQSGHIFMVLFNNQVLTVIPDNINDSIVLRFISGSPVVDRSEFSPDEVTVIGKLVGKVIVY